MNYKKVVLLIVTALVLTNMSVYAQNSSAKESHYLFPKFADAAVSLKTGELQLIMLNYNMLTEEMVFIKSGQYLAMTMLNNVDSVVIQNRTFIPVGKVFYELIAHGPTPLYLQHKKKMLATGKNTGFGTTQTSAIDNITNIVSSGKVYDLTIQGDFKLVSENSFWVYKDKEFQKFNNLRDAGRVFPDQSQKIKEFAKANKIDFGKPEDMKSLLQFIQGN